ncbi:MAG: MATE family efflux transporter [Candidatus Thermoplasmatota archaeon]|nr:MATE family efflux transporter [Candidatus Thermoplasmatota archaeon]
MSTKALDGSKDGSKETTKGVKTLLGNTQKAILKLSIPMIVAMSVQTIYNLADTIWVSGLGTEALAAVGFFFPFFLMIMALGAGLGIGGGAAISRRIGARDKKGADNVAEHVIIMMLILSLLFTVPVLLLLPWVFDIMGAGDATQMAVGYGRVIVGGSVIIFFANNANAILRAEGDTKRAMYAMILGSVLNIVLDPIFIYTFDMGVPGAAWATMVSFLVTALLLFYWLFLSKNTYVSFDLKNFRFKWMIIKDIMRVGLPASLQQMSMATQMFFLMVIVASVGGIDGVAIFQTGWRVNMVSILPLMGIASALVPVAGAAYGMMSLKKMKLALYHSIRYGLIFEMIISIPIFIFAPYIAYIFTWAESTADIRPDLVIFLRMFVIMSFTAGFGMLSGAFFQAIGKGFNSLIVTLFRTIIFALAFAYLVGVILDLGLIGVWIGILVGNTIGAAAAFLWVQLYIRKMKRKGFHDRYLNRSPEVQRMSN